MGPAATPPLEPNPTTVSSSSSSFLSSVRAKTQAPLKEEEEEEDMDASDAKEQIDVRSVVEAISTADADTDVDAPLYQVESLCMRCHENVPLSLSLSLTRCVVGDCSSLARLNVAMLYVLRLSLNDHLFWSAGSDEISAYVDSSL